MLGNKDGRLCRPRRDVGTDVQTSLRSRGMGACPAQAAHGKLRHLCYIPRGTAPAPSCSCPSSSVMLGLALGGQTASPCRRQLPLTGDDSAVQKQTLSQGSVCFPVFTTKFSTPQTFLKFSGNCFSSRLLLGAEGPHWEGSRENRPSWVHPPVHSGGLRGCVRLAGGPQTSHALHPPQKSSVTARTQVTQPAPLRVSGSPGQEPGACAITSPLGLSQASG